ncbi:dihydroneopterin aldolase [Bradyrhizobium sp. RDI18]|uniref:dihydroneopterin aldolase n=1 Tax=Bradyrhizobium sp. RDI18 TaxID=3367400 RepID=UPI00371472F4
MSSYSDRGCRKVGDQSRPSSTASPGSLGQQADTIFVHGLRVRVVVENGNIGTKTRQHDQDILLNLDISTDLSRPAVTDSLADTINYADIVAKIAEIAGKEAYCSIMSACAAFRAGPGRLNRVSASIGGASAGVRLPCGVAAG